MKKFCCITPDKGDRPELLEHCKFQMNRQTLRPGHHFIIDNTQYKGYPEVIDIVPRIRKGLVIAREHGYEYALIIENDDYYPYNYCETMINLFNYGDIIGIDSTWFYLLRYNQIKHNVHGGRSSLFCTGLKISALDHFLWPDNDMLYFDMYLWEFAAIHMRTAFLSLGSEPLAIGIKHNIGFSPGNGHQQPFLADVNTDSNDRHWLKIRTSHTSFHFYNTLIK